MGKNDRSNAFNAFDVPSINQQFQEVLKTKATLVYPDGSRLLIKTPKPLLLGLIDLDKEKHCKIEGHKISVKPCGGTYHIRSTSDFALLKFIQLAKSVDNKQRLSTLLG